MTRAPVEKSCGPFELLYSDVIGRRLNSWKCGLALRGVAYCGHKKNTKQSGTCP